MGGVLTPLSTSASLCLLASRRRRSSSCAASLRRWRKNGMSFGSTVTGWSPGWVTPVTRQTGPLSQSALTHEPWCSG